VDDRRQRVTGDDAADELPEHEDDRDVATQAGGGVMQTGGTAEVRGTGDRYGNAQELDEETRSSGAGATDEMPSDVDRPTAPTDATPGLRDFTEAADLDEPGRH
jgi:hypothetical protein